MASGSCDAIRSFGIRASGECSILILKFFSSVRASTSVKPTTFGTAIKTLPPRESENAEIATKINAIAAITEVNLFLGKIFLILVVTGSPF